MSDFTLGSSGSAHPKARGLPIGTRVKIVGIDVSKSTFKRTVRSGRNAGQEQEQYQLRVTYEAQDAGTSLAYEVRVSGKPVQTVPAAAFKAGDNFVQYFGGVYVKDAGGFTFTETGGAFGFVQALKDAGAPPSGRLADYAGIIATINHVSGRGPQGPWVQAVPGKILGRAEVAPQAAVTPAPAAAIAPPPATVASPTTPFGALAAEDQKAIIETMAGGQSLTAADLVEAGIVKTLDSAQAVLATVPKPTANPLLMRKAA